MQVPIEITYRHVDKSESIETLIREKVAKLEQVCDHITSCRISIEKPQSRTGRGDPYRVRLDIRVPPSHEIVAKTEPRNGSPQESLPEVIRETFEAARRQLKELSERQRGEVKSHPTQTANGVVTRLFRDGGYGFIRSADGRDIFFHQNSVLDNDFRRLEVGTGVRYIEVEGEEGPQASTVDLKDKRPHSPVV